MTSHPFSPWSLVAGLILWAAGAGFLARRHDLVSTEQLAVAVPVTLILLGIGGIALTLRRTS